AHAQPRRPRPRLRPRPHREGAAGEPDRFRADQLVRLRWPQREPGARPAEHRRAAGALVDNGFARRKLLGILSASWLAQACYAVARLGIPDLLAAGPRTAADLAATAGANPQALRRILRALAAAGVMRRTTAGEYELT